MVIRSAPDDEMLRNLGNNRYFTVLFRRIDCSQLHNFLYKYFCCIILDTGSARKSVVTVGAPGNPGHIHPPATFPGLMPSRYIYMQS